MTVQTKQATWNNVTNAYNKESLVNRTSKQLQKYWQNMKQRQRRQTSLIKYTCLEAGDGEHLEAGVDSLLSDVAKVTSHLDLEGSTWNITAEDEQGNNAPNNQGINKKTSKDSNDDVCHMAVMSACELVTSYHDEDHSFSDDDEYAARNTVNIVNDYSILSSSSHDDDVHESENFASEIVNSSISNPNNNFSHHTSQSQKSYDEKKLLIDKCDSVKKLRIRKFIEGILQKREPHTLRMKAVKAEVELARLKVRQFRAMFNHDCCDK